MTHNGRPVQPLGDREIWYNMDLSEYEKDIDLSKPPKDLDESIDKNAIETIKHNQENHGKSSSSQILIAFNIIFILVIGLMYVN